MYNDAHKPKGHNRRSDLRLKCHQTSGHDLNYAHDSHEFPGTPKYVPERVPEAHRPIRQLIEEFVHARENRANYKPTMLDSVRLLSRVMRRFHNGKCASMSCCICFHKYSSVKYRAPPQILNWGKERNTEIRRPHPAALQRPLSYSPFEWNSELMDL